VNIRHKGSTKFNLNDHTPGINSMRTSLLEAPLDLEALGFR